MRQSSRLSNMSGDKKGPSALGRLYLITYNLAAAFGWAMVVYTTFSSLFAGTKTVKLFNLVDVKPLPTDQLWAKLNPLLHIVQTAALLEVVHSLIKLVPSPWFTTFVQVASRVAVLWGFTNNGAWKHWSLYLLAASWSLVEVPRYLFYVWQLVFPNIPAPYPLFWLRYSLFSFLYPTGISGEIMQVWQILLNVAALKNTSTLYKTLYYTIYFLLSLYIPGGPFMYFHMIKTRAAQFKKRAEAAKPKPVETGLVFPIDKESGEVSTTNTGRAAFAAALGAVDPKLAQDCLAVKNWRFGYGKQVVAHVESIAGNSKKAVAAAEAGLKFCYDNFRFVRNGETLTLAQAMEKYTKPGFVEGKFVGKKPFTQGEIRVPYKGSVLSGDALKEKLKQWAAYGTIEPSCRDAISWAVDNKQSLDLRNHYFVLLGAGAAMGPILTLLELGANIIAIDLDRPAIWKRLLNLVADSPGTMYFPLRQKVDSTNIDELAKFAGCNLFTDTPEIATYVANILPDKKLIIGGYAYLDSAAHVQVSLAMDAIMNKAIQVRGRDKVSLAFLCSPTDVFATPKNCYDAAKENFVKAPFWQKILGLKRNGIACKSSPSVPKDCYLVDGLVIPQGPNYALAKRIQHWRAMLAYNDGITVSTNIAPSTATVSVVHNASFAAAYGGMHHFKPMEVMMQETSNAVMSALLLHDVLNPLSAKNPNSKANVKDDLSLLFAPGAFHGGVWRLGFKMNDIGPVAAVAFYLKKYAYVPAVLVGTIAYVASQGLPFQLPVTLP